MNHKQPIRPAIYVRAASKGRVGTGAIASQVDALRARIRHDDLVLEGSFCFIDEGASGISSHRPALDRLRRPGGNGRRGPNLRPFSGPPGPEPR